jgi:hypothetical protein
VQTESRTQTTSLVFDAGTRTRREEEQLATAMILNAVAEACGVRAGLRLDLSVDERRRLESTAVVAPQEWTDLLLGNRAKVCAVGVESADVAEVDASRRGAEGPAAATPRARAVFPGAFHPLHHGHRRMAELASGILGCRVEFEISIVNVDKPPLDFWEMQRRADQFASGQSHPAQTTWFTRAPTFRLKADLFPGATFVVGADTIARIAEPRYYQNDPLARDAAIEHVADVGCRFLVFGRSVDGRFETLDDLNLPAALARICQQVPQHEFRDDVSSTDLRRAAEAYPSNGNPSTTTLRSTDAAP